MTVAEAALGLVEACKDLPHPFAGILDCSAIDSECQITVVPGPKPKETVQQFLGRGGKLNCCFADAADGTKTDMALVALAAMQTQLTQLADEHKQLTDEHNQLKKKFSNFEEEAQQKAENAKLQLDSIITQLQSLRSTLA
eukprot:TRINITY_DN6620_c0_g1_i1.p1 TRINITY_DN6620_c0_g1~~TRINITY_DN6620_c0_g1_i1.p1  ORF type:complete len:140 (+),score=7.19 TRINITY_DN6620_c0_g1_i1:2-421(+)